MLAVLTTRCRTFFTMKKMSSREEETCGDESRSGSSTKWAWRRVGASERSRQRYAIHSERKPAYSSFNAPFRSRSAGTTPRAGGTPR